MKRLKYFWISNYRKFKNAHLFVHLSVLACIFIMFIVLISLNLNEYDDTFSQNILVEIHGAIIDSILIGSLVLFLNVRNEKKIMITTLKENIEFLKTMGNSYSSLKTLADCKKLLNFKCKPDLSSSKFSEIEIRKMIFTDYYLYSLDIYKCVIDEIDFRYSNMRYSRFENSKFFKCDFRGVNLHGSMFKDCFLSNCSFQSTLLENIVFENVEFEYVDFTDAFLNNVSFVNCKFTEPTFRDTLLNNTILHSKVKFDGTKITENDCINHKPLIDLIENKEMNLKFKSKIACNLNEMIHGSGN